MWFTVTQTDITMADVYNLKEKPPIAYAIEAGIPGCIVMVNDTVVFIDGKRYDLPDDAIVHNRQFARGNTVKPFSFCINSLD